MAVGPAGSSSTRRMELLCCRPGSKPGAKPGAMQGKEAVEAMEEVVEETGDVFLA